MVLTSANLVVVHPTPAPRPPSRQPLDVATLERAVPRRVPGWTVEVLEASPSTSTALSRQARAGAPTGRVVVTEHQTAGRGRLDRVWVTPPRAALTFSVLLRPGAPVERWTWVPLLTGLAVVRGVLAAGGPRCGLKWPNDVLYAESKLAGLLAEHVPTPDGPAVVVGVGLNVTTRRDELPVDTATSLALTDRPVADRTSLLVEVLASLRDVVARWEDDPRSVREDYRLACLTLGRRVRAHLPSGQVLEGLAAGVGDDGSLLVDTAAGRRSVSAGDVVHLRTA